MSEFDAVAKLQAEIVRQNKVIQALMNRAERNTSTYGSNFNLFQTTITLESQIRQRTLELEASRHKTEIIARELRESENRYRLIIDNSPIGIHELDLDGRVISMNRAGLLMRGLKNESEVLWSSYLEIVSPADQERIHKLLKLATAGETCHFEFKCNTPEEQFLKSCFVPIKDKNGVVIKLVGISEDITKRKQNEEQIHKLAFYDTLTQLPNRRLLLDRLKQAMNTSKRTGSYGVVMFMDLDNFKGLNDSYGHDMGDLLLVETAHRLNGCIREMDTVARFGGDEFVVIVSMLDTDKDKALNKAATVAEKILSALGEPYVLNKQCQEGQVNIVEYSCTASIGMVLLQETSLSPEDIFKQADTAMYKAKAEGGNRMRFSS